MNPNATTRLPAFAGAALLTLAMLLGVDTLAGGEAPAPQLVQTSAPTAHS